MQACLRFFHLPLCLFAFFSLTGCNEDEPNQKTLVVGVAIDNPPFEFYLKDHPDGFDIDLIKAIAKKINRSIDIQDISFEGIISALQTKRIDLAISTIFVTDERRQAVDFSDVYHYMSPALLLLKGIDIHDVNDLSERTVSVQTGSTFETFAVVDLKRKHMTYVRSLPSIDHVIKDLKAGFSQVGIVDDSVASDVTSKYPEFRSIILSEHSYPMAIAFPKDSDALNAQVNKALAQLKEEGTLDKLVRKWLRK